MTTTQHSGGATLEWLISSGDVAGDPARYSTVRAAAIEAKLAAGEVTMSGQLDVGILLSARMEVDLGVDRTLLSFLLSGWQGMFRSSSVHAATLHNLLKHGLPADAAPDGVPLLHIVAAGDLSESVQLLVNAGADLDVVCESAALLDSRSTRNISAVGLSAIELARSVKANSALHALEIARARSAMLKIAAAAADRRQ